MAPGLYGWHAAVPVRVQAPNRQLLQAAIPGRLHERQWKISTTSNGYKSATDSNHTPYLGPINIVDTRAVVRIDER